ncbi:hypothetical protein JI435_043200 [Parastagonospora nodorum SN15]|uniref:Uncharacterized protein n=1 Tax=Phaeosphaeria nodorum (strain SN15 / ATCC MYA-4574 / FGSC 10173) TaxID=321614 RepID=A0A7U2I011_PHANO|nr:hypothetical protein JI435_043200 [Parastagonospora nodorum SN15]
MPTLKDLKCSIELSESQRALQEFGTTYGDGCVETFVPVPSKPQAFSIHLTSDKFIAPGISMYVFVDGVYQCNRNRQDLKLRKSSDSRSVVDFRVRQKEEKQKDGSMIAREWKFEKLNTTSADEAPDACSPNFLDNIGCIEVLILRCAGPRNAKTISAMSLDGSGDIPPPPFGFDGQPRTPNIRSVYDDRVPFFGGGSNNHGPPPPISSYRSPYAETVRSHETLHRGHRNRHILNNNKISPFAGSGQHRTHSRFSEPISPGARPPPSIPSEAFQYGSGPIPPGPMMGSERSFYHNRPTTAVAANAPGVDPAWLSEMLTTAVKRGVEEARRVEPAASETQEQHVMNVKTSSQPPGAWPQSPYAPDAPQTVQFPDAGGGYHDTEEYGGATWGSPEGEWSNSQAKEKSKAHVSWDTESKWESQTNAGGWNGVEETASDTWDSDKTLEARKPDIRRAGKWNTSRAPTIRSRFDERASSPLTTRTRQSHRSSEGHRSRRTRSKSHPRSSRRDEKYSSSSKDCDGWNRVEASSGSLASSELTDEREQRPRSRSHTHNSRNRSQSRRRSHRTQSAHGEERRPSRYDRGGGSETTSKRRNSMSMASGISPSVMQAPLPTQQSAYQPQFQARSVNYAEPTATIPKTHLGWVPAPSETYHKPSFAASNALPGHFSVNGEALDHRGSSTSWDNSKEKKWGKEKTAKSMNSQYDGIPAARDSWGSGNDHQQPGWDAEGDNGWEGKTTGDDLKNGWQVTEKGNKPKGAWGVTEEQQTGWATDENGWEAKDLENADKKVPGGWDAGFSGTSAQYPPMGHHHLLP